MSVMKIKKTSFSSSPPTFDYMVKPGDTLCSLAVKFSTSQSCLRLLNSRTLGGGCLPLFPGMQLCVPSPTLDVPEGSADADGAATAGASDASADSRLQQQDDNGHTPAAESHYCRSISDELSTIDVQSLGWTLLDLEPERRILPDRSSLPLPRLLMLSLDAAASAGSIDAVSGPLTAYRLRRLTEALPNRAEGLDLRMVFSTGQHGHSLQSLYQRVADFSHPSCYLGSDCQLDPATCCLLLVGDTRGRAFGAFLSCPVRAPSPSCYGTGETFVFRFLDSATADSSDEAPTEQFESFQATGVNAMFIRSSVDALSVGTNALTLTAGLQSGCTGRCETFNSPPLTGSSCGSNSEDFTIGCVQLWAFQVMPD